MKPSSPLGIIDWLSFAGSFLLVLCVMALLYYVLKRLGNGGLPGQNVRQLQLLESHALGNRQKLVLVRAKDREILLGITMQQISPLATWTTKEGSERESIVTPASGTGMEITSGATLKRMMARLQRSEAKKP